MRRILDVLRLKFDGRLSDRSAGRSLGMARTTVRDYVLRFERSGLGWPLDPEVGEEEVERALFRRGEFPPPLSRPLPDWAMVGRELKKKGVTLHLLWQEYREREPQGYGYSQFAVHYRSWLERIEPVMRQEYKAGELALVDYAGLTADVVDVSTGELREAQVFVAALGASNYTYAEATWTQRLQDWIASHVRAVEYFRGSPQLWVPDNLRSGVRKSCYYEPTLNPTYAEFAAHYQSAVLPARVGRARDKAKVETAVQIVEREILAPLRHHTFTSLGELNGAIGERLERLNTRAFQKLEGSRRELFEAIERPALTPLPAERYEYAECRQARVNIDYHISVEKHCYSVPHRLVREKVMVRMTAAMIEVLHKGKRVAVHTRSRKPGGYTTDPSHRPKAHQKRLEWPPSRVVAWGKSIGAATGAVVDEILRSKPHPEMGYRACLGILSLAKRYGNDRLERAADRALRTGAVGYGSIKSILRNSLDRAPVPDTESETRLPQLHQNIRGSDYYADLQAGLQLNHLHTAAEDGGTPGTPEPRSPVIGQVRGTFFPDDPRNALHTGSDGPKAPECAMPSVFPGSDAVARNNH